MQQTLSGSSIEEIVYNRNVANSAQEQLAQARSSPGSPLYGPRPQPQSRRPQQQIPLPDQKTEQVLQDQHGSNQAFRPRGTGLGFNDGTLSREATHDPAAAPNLHAAENPKSPELSRQGDQGAQELQARNETLYLPAEGEDAHQTPPSQQIRDGGSQQAASDLVAHQVDFVSEQARLDIYRALCGETMKQQLRKEIHLEDRWRLYIITYPNPEPAAAQKARGAASTGE